MYLFLRAKAKLCFSIPSSKKNILPNKNKCVEQIVDGQMVTDSLVNILFVDFIWATVNQATGTKLWFNIVTKENKVLLNELWISIIFFHVQK